MALCLVILLTAAAVSDLNTCRVSNTLIVFGCGLGLLLRCLDSGWQGFGLSFLGMAVPFLLLFFPVSMSMLGAGDAKTLMMAGSFLGPVMGFWVLVWSFLLAGLWSLGCLLRGALWRQRLAYMKTYLRRCRACGHRLPYTEIGRLSGREAWTLHFTVFIAAALLLCLAHRADWRL